jgi:membrane associated rhomboid family serine protease
VPEPSSETRPDVFPLRGKARDIVLTADEVLHPWSGRGWGLAATAYADICHLAITEKFVWISARKGLSVLARNLFVHDEDAERLMRALVERISELPDGPARLQRMGEIESWAHDPAPPRVARILAVVCLLLYGLQLLFWQVTAVAHFSPALFVDGDWWRLLTANLLHSFHWHILMNLVIVLVVGRLVERAIGPLRMLCVLGASGVGAMALSGWFATEPVVGVSGVALGLVGSLLFLESARGDDLPAWWRFPRPFLIFVWFAVAVEAVFGFVSPIIAGEAHLGGMIAGAATTALVTRRGRLREPESPWVRNLAGLTAAVTLVAVGAAGNAWLGADDFISDHGERLLRMPDIHPATLNNYAWMIAIDPDHSEEQLGAALALAERAVADTEGEESTLLDTLAEVQFQLGRREDAILTIDLALERAPDESHWRYYYEQRRRFTGERDADDRPADPQLVPWAQEEEAPTLPPEDGLVI